MLGISAILHRTNDLEGTDDMTRHQRPSAFTLLELLIVIGVIAIILAIALPALRNARKAPETTRILSTHRQLLAATFMYTADHRDTLPYIGPAHQVDARRVFQGYTVPFPYFGQKWIWISLVAPKYFDLPATWYEGPPLYGRRYATHPIEIEFHADAPHDFISTSFLMTYAAFADPLFFEGDTTSIQPHLFRPTRTTEVRSPSRKGALITPSAPEDEDRFSSGLFDGSANVYSFPPDDSPLWDERVVNRGAVGGYASIPVLSTRGGLRGVDFD